MQDPAYQPQPDPEHNQRRTPAERGAQSLLAPDDLRKVKPTDTAAGKAEQAPDQDRGAGKPHA